MTGIEFENYVANLIQDYGEYDVLNTQERTGGRATIHQVDIIGINKFCPTFSYPITLLIECKYTSTNKAIGINAIRNLYAVWNDIKQKRPNGYQRPDFVGNGYNNGTSNIIAALISNVGFSVHVRRFAYAHGIFLYTVPIPTKKGMKTQFFGNIDGTPVIVHSNHLLDSPDKAELRDIIITQLLQDDDKSNYYISKSNLKGSIVTVKEKLYKDPESKENIVTYLHKVKLEKPLQKIELSFVSQHKLRSGQLSFNVEFPKAGRILTIDVNK